MPTGQVIITNAINILGIGDGGAPSASDSQVGLDELNSFWSAWGIDEGLIFAQQQQTFALTANVGVYFIGPGATAPFNVALPSRIYQASYLTSDGRNELKIVNANVYYAHNDLGALAKAPDELYADFLVGQTSGQAKIVMWPVGSGAGNSLELITGATFGLWALVTNYNIPQGYQDAIQNVLAFRLLSYFGAAVDQSLVANITAKAQAGEARLRSMNAINRQMPPGTSESPAIRQAMEAQQLSGKS